MVRARIAALGILRTIEVRMAVSHTACEDEFDEILDLTALIILF